MNAITKFWKEVRAVLGESAPVEPPEAFAFGDNPALADELLALVLEGTKTATCDALWSYEARNEAVPEPGNLWIILDGSGRPRCVIETTEARVMPMNEVDPQFAYDEGEDDRTWESWYAAHETYFGRTLAEIGRAFDPLMPLVLERFSLRFAR
jgi:uncharacterized protein YhfF